MNRLPKVLQQEIWEYVRGDRAYWKRQFRRSTREIEPMRQLHQGTTYEYKKDGYKYAVFWSTFNDGKWHIFLRDTTTSPDEWPPVPVQVYPRPVEREQEARARARIWFWRFRRNGTFRAVNLASFQRFVGKDLFTL